MPCKEVSICVLKIIINSHVQNKMKSGIFMDERSRCFMTIERSRFFMMYQQNVVRMKSRQKTWDISYFFMSLMTR